MPHHDGDETGPEESMPMPGGPDPSQDETNAEKLQPPSFGLQMAQLVVIPAVIVVVCIGLAVLFGLVAGAKDDIDTHLLNLRQSSGTGKLPMGLQDPRYKDRGLAAYNIATMIPHITAPSEKQRISKALVDILDQHVANNEDLLGSYLLIAIGQLGQAGGLDAIIKRLDAPQSRVRQAAVGGVLSWPHPDQARQAIGDLQDRLLDQEATVRSTAAAALGQLGQPGDLRLINALRDAMEQSTGLVMREARWNAAVALARLGDAKAGRFVADVLLDREALSQMPAGETGTQAQQKMTRAAADRVMLAAIISVGQSDDPSIQDKIRQIADNDPSRLLRSTAQKLLHKASARREAVAGGQ